MRRTAFLMAALAAAVAPGPAVLAEAPKPEPRWDMIAFDMKYWGRPRWSWIIASTGGGSWTEAVTESGAPLGNYKVVVHGIEAGDAGWRELQAILTRLPSPVPDYDECKQTMTDQPYGTLRLTRGSTTTEIAWNAGCLDEDYKAFLDILKSADTLAGEWGRSGKVLRSGPGPAG